MMERFYDSLDRSLGYALNGVRQTTLAHDTATDTIPYCCNSRSEPTNAVAAIDSDYRYAYAYDDIGNRESSSERGTNFLYTANNLNQYTAVDDFTPQFDDDGNQALIKTATGIWSVAYNGENRPILWTCIQSNNQTITNNQTISMSFDRMGRRVTKNEQRFVYDGYLQIANFELQTLNIKLFCKSAMNGAAEYGGYGCLILHELLHKHGIKVTHAEYDASEKSGVVNPKERAIVRLTQLLSKLGCHVPAYGG